MPDLYSSHQPKKAEKEKVVEEVVSSVEGTKCKPKINRDFLPGKTGNSFSSFLVLPHERVRFENQEPEEEILMILRRHTITNIPWILISFLLLLSPFVLTTFPLLVSFPWKYQLVFVIVWYLVLLMFVFEKFLTWFFNLTIITDERIIDVDFINLTTKKVSDCELDKIQDVSFTNSGVFGTIFNFGDVNVQTAAEISEFEFEQVPRPDKVAEVLQRLRTEEKIEALEGRIR